MTVVALAGCRPEPLGSYLKALGICRLVGQQLDPAAQAWWDADGFRLDSTLERDDLTSFFLERYRPTPVLSPWNKDSGFKEGSSSATATLRSFEADDDPRFAAYRAAIEVVRRLRSRTDWTSLDKAQQVSLLRNNVPDDALDWIDAAIVLRAEKPAFPALLGAGGNFGRLELSPTFIARVRQVLGTAPAEVAASSAWIVASLFEEGSPSMRKDPVGQFVPGAAGGLRAAGGGSGSPISNPWDFVLTIEGAVLWSSGVARRLSGGASMASIPFSVSVSPAGQSTLSAPGQACLSPKAAADARKKLKAELWAPLWSQPMSLPELRRLFTEGRISWSQRQARSGADAVRAIQTLGVDAGVKSFVRHVVADRLGQSPLAVPVGRFPVVSRQAVAVTATVDRWSEWFERAARGAGTPTSMVSAATALSRATFEARDGTPSALQRLLIAVAGAEAAVGATEERRADGGIPPVPWLPTRDWLAELDDGTPELRLVASLAVARDDSVEDQADGVLRSLVRPLATTRGGGDRFGRLEWTRAAPVVRGLGPRPVAQVLADALVARSEAPRSTNLDDAVTGACEPWFPAALSAASGDVEALAAGAVDLGRFAELLPALLLLRPDPRFRGHSWRTDTTLRSQPIPAWRLLSPFYSRHALDDSKKTPPERLRAQITWARRLVNGDVEGVVADALLRLRQGGHVPLFRSSSAGALATGVDGPRLATALLACPPVGDIAGTRAASTQPDSSEGATP